ncbi:MULTISPECIES: hypothetical protein [Saccharomonospora]|jgi:hypothetical protein|uniref:Uncharacterized protein n=2 Tax=Saccharomonospora viridis TaxID=1852 RepID=C7MRP2_SACVD|nr:MULTISPECIES: hypothetical protein [Saccharomonospora]ACU95104.1 hypothetical protein Svir_00110 [Saccharomonospora viridis DSM 43017]SFP21739.1 hypothetical protein SAMN02982918_1717 [Saccharomonospora viridis]
MGAARPDFLLQAFVDAANQMEDFSMGVTLSVAGGIISGDLVTAPRWMDEVATLVEMEGSEAAYHVANVYREQAGLYKKRAAQNRGEVHGEVTYIHLRDAQWLLDGHRLGPTPGMHWRGLLTEVSGWALGRLPLPAMHFHPVTEHAAR